MTGTESVNYKLNLQRLRFIKQPVKDMVYGYIRQESKIYGMQIPEDVDNLCLLYFYLRSDKWDKKCVSKKITIQNENTLIVGGGCHGSGTSSFLTEIIDSFIFEWKFKIEQLQGKSSTIGVWKINDNHSPNEMMNRNCFLTGRGGKGLSVSQLLLKKGDVLTVIIDLNIYKLIYKQNDVEIKTLSIEQGKYRGVVNMYQENDSITLLQNK